MLDQRSPLDAQRAFDGFMIGPGTPGGRYMRAFWQPVARSGDR
jgi:hypothetical protein